MSNAPSKPVSFSRPKVGYFSNRPRMCVCKYVCVYDVLIHVGMYVILNRARGARPKCRLNTEVIRL